MAKYLDGTGLSKAFELIKAWVTTNFLSDVSYNSTSKKIQKTKNGTTSDVVALSEVAISGDYDDLDNLPTIPTVPGDFTGATSSAAGTHGLVPAPAAGEQTKIILGDGDWHKPGLYWVPSNGNEDPYYDTLQLFLGTEQLTPGGPVEYITDGMLLPLASSVYPGLMSKDYVSAIEALIAAAPEANVQSDWNQADTTADDYIKNKPAISGSTWYGTSSTSASTAAKVVTCENFVLAKGSIISVLFSTANTAATPTLNVNSTGAKSIYVGASTPSATANVLKWSANTLVTFMYDGTYFRFLDAVAAGSVAPPRGANTWYGSCSTAAGTAAKTATIDNFVLTKGAVVVLQMTTANTVNDAAITLNVNSTGAKTISERGTATSYTNYFWWDAGDTVAFIYNGTNWCVINKHKYKDFTGATSMNAGVHGLVPAPAMAQHDYVLFGDGMWHKYWLDYNNGNVRLIYNDGTNDVVSGSAYVPDTDTKNTAGSTDSSSKLFLIGATSQAANPQTYSQDTAYVGTDGHLYSNSKQVVNLSDSQALTNKSYNGYTLGAACEKSIGSVADGNTGLVTGDAVYDAIQDALGDTAGALVYKGTAATASAISGTSYKKGWYWIASATFALTSGINVEPGDMIIAKQDKTSTFANDIDVVQTNIDTLTEAEVTALWNAA